MNVAFLDTLGLIGQIAAGFLPPGISSKVANAINLAIAGIHDVQSEIANEARLRGIPPEQLHAQLIAENDALMAESGQESVAQHIRDRIAETQRTTPPVAPQTVQKTQGRKAARKKSK